MAIPVLVGISQCLLGDNVRYDGGHKRDSVLIEALGRYVEWVPVCPEVEIGLGTPREPMRLVGDLHAPRLITTNTGVDHTDAMTRFAQQRFRERLHGTFSVDPRRRGGSATRSANSEEFSGTSIQLSPSENGDRLLFERQ